MGWVQNIVTALKPCPHNPSAEAIADPDVLRLFHRIDELRRLDAALEVHGARKHRYRYRPLSEGDLALLESKLGTELPGQLRRWLSCAGTGAGPSYGLTCSIWGDATLAPLPPLPDNVIPDVGALTPELLISFATAREERALDYLFGVASTKGLLRLCEHGCGWESWLILAGPLKGRVIDQVATAPPEGAEAAFLPGGGRGADRLPTFFEWLEDWVDLSLKELDWKRSRRSARDG